MKLLREIKIDEPSDVIKTIYAEPAKKRNEFYDPSSFDPEIYVIPNVYGQTYKLYQLQIVMESADNPEEEFDYQEEGTYIYFWATSIRNEDALMELAKFVINIENIAIRNAEKQPPFINSDSIIYNAYEYIEACEDWVASINPEYAVFSGTFKEASIYVQNIRYKFRKACEVIQNLNEHDHYEIILNHFKEMVEKE